MFGAFHLGRHPYLINEYAYIHRCASAIGHNGNKQQMRMGDLCPAGSVIHEWGHSIGLWHTQSRPDRDDYVQIMWDNILPGTLGMLLGQRGFSMLLLHYGVQGNKKIENKKVRHGHKVDQVE